MTFKNNDPLFWSRNAVRAYAAIQVAHGYQFGHGAAGGRSGIVNPSTGQVDPPPPQPTTYTVSFTSDGAVVGTAQVVENAAIGSELPTPTKFGYDFLGWFTEETDGTQIGSDTTITSDVTFYAKWQETDEGLLVNSIANANEGDTVQVANNTTLTQPLEINKTLQLDLNKNTLEFNPTQSTRSSDGVAAIVVKGGTLTVRNGTIVGTDVGIALEGGSVVTAKATGDIALTVKAGTPIVVKEGDLNASTGTFISTDEENGTAIEVVSNNGANKSVTLGTPTFTSVNAVKETDAGGEQSNTTFTFNGTVNGNVDLVQKKTITSGTFQVGTIEPDMVADGYVLANKSTTYTVKPESAIIARTQDNELFTTVENAYKYIGKYVEGKTGTVTMLQDQICNGTFGIDIDIAPVYSATVTIDFNGHKIISNCTRNGAVQIGKINGSVSPNITFKDSAGGGGVESPSVVPVWVSAKSHLTIEGGTFSGGGAEVVYLQNAATCDIKGGTFKTSAVSSTTHDKSYILNRLDSGTGKFILSGGTYEFDVATGKSGTGEVELAEGYTSRDNGDGTWTIVPVTE